MRVKSVFVCGGDMRSVFIAEYFRKKDYNVTTFGHRNNKESFKGVHDADVVVLGLPAVKEGMVYMPLSEQRVPFSELLEKCHPKTLVCGGRFLAAEKLEAKKWGVKLWDYSEDEIFQIENALYTAEGALSRLIENTPASIRYCRILIAGYGRIGKALVTLMNSFVWDVWVYARRNEVCAEIEAKGINVVSDISALGEFDVIINTVPCSIFSEEALKTTKKEVLLVDLSARPGYVDKDTCKKLNRKLMYLPGVPLWSAPQSAGISAAKAVERFTEGIE